VVIVAGFQGVDADGNITTLGRGGSDTSGVALAAALQADECHIYTDVDGVYTTDPRVVPEARKLDRITFEEMLEMASLGSKVLQIRSVEFAGKYKVKLRVLSSFEEEGQETSGTLITLEEDSDMEHPIISGIAFNRDEAKLTVLGVPDRPGIAYQILGAIADANIDVDMIIQNVGHDGTTDFSFTVNRGEYMRARKILEEQIKPHVGARAIDGDNLGNQDIGGSRREIHRTRRAYLALSVWIGSDYGLSLVTGVQNAEGPCFRISCPGPCSAVASTRQRGNGCCERRRTACAPMPGSPSPPAAADVRCHGNRDKAAPSCCHPAGCGGGCDPGDGRSIHADYPG